MEVTKIKTAWRSISAGLDNGIYKLISFFYNLIFDISGISIFSLENIEAFATKIYTFLAIFMFFKVSFSLVNYMVNPDKFTESGKGIQRLVINIVAVLAMIIIAPTVFSTMYSVQTAILDDKVLPRMILGDIDANNTIRMSPLCEEDGVYTDNEGDYFALTIFRGFYQPDYLGLSESAGTALITTEAEYNANTNIQEEIQKEFDLQSDVSSDYCAVVPANVTKLLDESILNAEISGTGSDRYVIDYTVGISTFAGIVIMLLLLSFCFDVAIRSIKLSFLQIISPIPIVSYIDPESGKKGMFNKWLKEVGITWADLFIRLASLYFGIYALRMVSSTLNTGFTDINGDTLQINSHASWIYIILVIGILMFAKKFPDLLKEMFNIKPGKLQLNPFKRISEEAIGGKTLLGAATSVASLPGNAANLAYNLKKGMSGREAFKNLRSNVASSYKSGKEAKVLGGAMNGLSKTSEGMMKTHVENAKLRKEKRDSDKIERRGEALFNQAKDVLVNGKPVDDKKTGKNKKDYSTVFRNKDYAESYRKLQRAKDADKNTGDNIKMLNNMRDSLLSKQSAIVGNSPEDIKARKEISERIKTVDERLTVDNKKKMGTEKALTAFKKSHERYQKDTRYKEDFKRQEAVEGQEAIYAAELNEDYALEEMDTLKNNPEKLFDKKTEENNEKNNKTNDEKEKETKTKVTHYSDSSEYKDNNTYNYGNTKEETEHEEEADARYFGSRELEELFDQKRQIELEIMNLQRDIDTTMIEMLRKPKEAQLNRLQQKLDSINNKIAKLSM